MSSTKASHIKTTLLRQPLNIVVDIQAHRGLPNEPTDSRADTVWFIEDRFLRVYVFIPKESRGAEPTMLGRVAIDGDHHHPFEVALVLATGNVNDPANLFVGHIPHRVREITLDVEFDDAGGLRIVLRDLVDAFDEVVDGGYRAHSLSVVEGVRGKDFLGDRNDDLANFVVYQTAFELGSHNLPPTGDGDEEGIVLVYLQGLILPVIEVADEVREPGVLITHSIAPVPLVLSRVKVHADKVGEIFVILFHLFQLSLTFL